jgi:hypothetical protein
MDWRSAIAQTKACALTELPRFICGRFDDSLARGSPPGLAGGNRST